jgi:hypothetical protein
MELHRIENSFWRIVQGLRRCNVHRGAVLAISAASAIAAACFPASDQNESSTPAELRLVALPTHDHLGGLAREPMIVEGSDGSLFVSGYGAEKPTLWRSSDHGSSWVAVDVGGEADGAVGNSDVDLAVAEDGALYYVVMSYDRQAFEGRGIAVASSQDEGTTWTWTSLSRDRFDDRPWIEVDPHGVAHAIWNDGAGVSHAVSSDRGLTWSELPRVQTSGGSSHLAIGPTGKLAVRLTPLSASGNKFEPGTDAIAVSTNGGASWELRDLPGTRAWSSSLDPNQDVPRWVEPVAWDSTGALFTLWSEGTVLWLARSPDAGLSWSQWPVVEDSVMLYFPYLVGHGKGELAATWFAGVGDSLRANLALISIVDGSAEGPEVIRAEPFSIPAFQQADASSPPIRDTAGEYLPIVFLKDGSLATVSTIQDPVNNRWGFTFRPYRVDGRSGTEPSTGGPGAR